MHIKEMLWKVEDAFDQNNESFFSNLLNENNEIQYISEFIIKIKNGFYNDAIVFGKELFLSVNEPIIRGFVHQWVLSCMDALYLPNERAQWIFRWSFIDSRQIPWLQFIKKYQIAVGLYFDGNLRDSLALFEQLINDGQQIGYLRGVEKSYFHIGLIYKCINQMEKSKINFNQALKIAQQRSSSRSLSKIEAQLRSLINSNWHVSPYLQEVENLLMQKKLRKARKLLLFALRIRRIEGVSRESRSETMYMALVSLAFGNVNRFSQIFNLKIRDNVIKEKTLSLALELGLTLDDNFIEELQFLRQILGITVSTSIVSSHFLGTNLNKIKDNEAVQVIQNLTKKAEGMSKEELCTNLWNYNYDPVIHDPKIYNLIYRIKKIFQCKDLIVAASGSYRINPKYMSS